MKKYLTLLFFLSLLVFVPLSAAAAENQVVFTIGNSFYDLNEQTQAMDAAPFVKSGRTYVPLRYLALSLGVPGERIKWNPADQIVTLEKDGVTITLAVGSKVIYVNFQPQNMDVAPVIKSGRTYLPARYVAEALGYKVGWDANTQTVLIGPPGKLPTGGEHWLFSQRLGTETFVCSLAYLGSNICLAGTFGKYNPPTGKIWRSTDGGQTWNLAQQLEGRDSVLCFLYLDSGICLAGAGGGRRGEIYRSTDRGQTWSLVQRLGKTVDVWDLVYLGSNICLAATAAEGQIWRSTDGGQTWNLAQQLSTEPSANVYSLAYLGSNICLAGMKHGGEIYRSTDGGQTWNLAQQLDISKEGAKNDMEVRKFAYLGSNVCLATTSGGQIWRSTDGGQTWNLAQQLEKVGVWGLVYLGSNVCLAGATGGQIWRSTDGGQTWNLAQQLEKKGGCVTSFIQLDSGICLAGTGFGSEAQIWRSTSMGIKNSKERK